MTVPVALYLCYHWYYQFFFYFNHSNCLVVSRCFKCNSLLTYNVEHLFICLFAICISSLVRCPDLWLIFLNLILAVLGLRCCAWAFLQLRRVGATLCCGAWSYCGGFSCGAWALGTWASVLVAHGLNSCGPRALEHRLSSCGVRAQLLCSMWDLPGSGLEPVSPALAGGFLTTVPPGKSWLIFKLYFFLLLCFKSFCTFSIAVLYQICILQIFSPSLWLVY